MQQRSYLNLSDVPELMPGALPKATKAQQDKFEQRCRLLHREEVQEASFNLNTAFSDTAVATSNLEEMFPHLDATLIQSLQTEARTEREAIEVLLALSAAVVQPDTITPSKPQSLGIENHLTFPSLIDADGWQVPCKRLHEEDLGTAWCCLAKTAVHKPAPKGVVRSSRLTATRSRRQGQREAADDLEEGAYEQQVFTDYEHRHQKRWRRAQHPCQYGQSSHRRGVVASANAENSDSNSEEEAFNRVLRTET